MRAPIEFGLGLQELDLKESAYLQANCKAQMLKVKVIEQRLLSFTYTDQTVPALKAVERHLAAAEQETDTTHQQACRRLQTSKTGVPCRIVDSECGTVSSCHDRSRARGFRAESWLCSATNREGVMMSALFCS